MACWRLIAALLLFRIFNSLFVITYFNPDEYWQSVEVAHNTVFGYGFLTWEWQDFARLRGFLHPAVFAGLFKILQVSGLDTPDIIAYSPRILQALLATVGDVYLFKLTQRWFGEIAARWALFCQAVDWFYFFVIVRTFSNCLETVLTVVAFYYWPWASLSGSKSVSNKSNRAASFIFAAMAILIRPPSAIVWLVLGMKHLLQSNDRAYLMFGQVLPIGAVAISVSCLVDRIFYGIWTLVPFNFVAFNVLQGGSAMYGTHPFHWYFTEGLATTFGTCIPFLFIGVYSSRRYWPAALMVIVVTAYSFNPHKELRFILPVLPLGFMYCGYALAMLQSQLEFRKKLGWIFKPSVAVLLLSNIPAIYFFCRVHQRAPVEVIETISRRLSHPGLGDRSIESVHFLTSCHATPFYSQIHRSIPLRQLDCSPRFESGKLVGDRSESESEQFLSDPGKFVTSFYRSGEALPSHVVVFEEHVPALASFLESNGFVKERKFFHSYFESSRFMYLYGRDVAADK